MHRRLSATGQATKKLPNFCAGPHICLLYTSLRDHPEPYDLGEGEFHIAFRTSAFESAYALHSEMGCICFENKEMGLYFISDPDGYWIEILPERE